MSEGYSIEVGDEIVGIVVRNDGERDFRFHSAVKGFNALDGRVFHKPAAAERAARAHAAQGRVSAVMSHNAPAPLFECTPGTAEYVFPRRPRH